MIESSYPDNLVQIHVQIFHEEIEEIVLVVKEVIIVVIVGMIEEMNEEMIIHVNKEMPIRTIVLIVKWMVIPQKIVIIIKKTQRMY